MSEKDRIGSVMNMEDSRERTIHARITYGKEPLNVNIHDELSEEEKAVADKAAKLIARDYGEVIKKLEDE